MNQNDAYSRQRRVMLARTDFASEYQDLCPGRPEFGAVAALPWDREIFNFAVGEYKRGDYNRVANNVAHLRSALEQWSCVEGIELCSCAVPALDRRWTALLSEIGFAYVDATLEISLPSLQSSDIPEPRNVVRRSEPADFIGIADIAERSFQFGRYFADVRFPKHLAALRYRRWIENVLKRQDELSYVYVSTDDAGVAGFCHVSIDGRVADLRLIAVDVRLQRTLAGFDIYAATLRDLRARGVARVTGKISCANTAVMNVLALLGFRYSAPENVFHWHAKGAPHLSRLDGGIE